MYHTWDFGGLRFMLRSCWSLHLISCRFGHGFHFWDKVGLVRICSCLVPSFYAVTKNRVSSSFWNFICIGGWLYELLSEAICLFMSTQWLITLLIVSHGISIPPAGMDKHVWWLGSWDSLAFVCVLVCLHAFLCLCVHAYACLCVCMSRHMRMWFTWWLMLIWWFSLYLLDTRSFTSSCILLGGCLPYAWQIQATCPYCWGWLVLHYTINTARLQNRLIFCKFCVPSFSWTPLCITFYENVYSN